MISTMELVVLASSVVLACSAYLLKPLRSVLAALALLMHGFGVGLVVANLPSVFGIAFLIVSVFQLFNIARLLARRLHSRHLKLAFFVGGSRLLIMQSLLYVMDWAYFNIEWFANLSRTGFFILMIIAALATLLATMYRLRASRPKQVTSFMSDKELPSISVLIPARNESSDLLELLRTVVANDYPKLEILVLDDCSSTDHVPEIVREFAHDGVRFIRGDSINPNWLAKNQAYDALAKNSSGDWVVFMGVDVRLGVGSLRALIHYATTRNVGMISVLPRRYGSTFWSGFFTPLRHFKEMLKTGMFKSNAPALSTLWLIKRSEFTALGGMPSVARKVIPEHYFANHMSIKHAYAFVRSNDYLQVSTAKPLSEQLATSIRTLYPGLHQRMEWTALTSVGLGFLYFVPFVGLVWSLLNQSDYAVVYGAATALLTLSHTLVITYTNPILWPLSLINFPYLVLQEIALYVVSMYKYEFGEVMWKDRNICLPVLQAIPKLPGIDTKH